MNNQILLLLVKQMLIYLTTFNSGIDMSIAIDLEPTSIVNTVTTDTVKEYNSDETCKVAHLSSSNDDT